MSKSIKVQFDKLDKLQEEILEENETLVRTFFSICIFDESQAVLEKAEKSVKETLNINQFRYYIPGYENLGRIHFSCVPTNQLYAGTIPDTHYPSHSPSAFSCSAADTEMTTRASMCMTGCIRFPCARISGMQAKSV